ncbi:hypothetical protein ACFL28_03970 [Candidatus Omnitrophota bacterium]
MSKRYTSLFIALNLILIFSKSIYAAPAYGTHMPEVNKWIAGLEGSFIIDRDLDNDEGASSNDRYFLTLSYGIFSWLSFDGKIGVGNVDWDRNAGDNLNYSTNFAGGYGFRIKGYENEEWGVKSAIGFQHISVHPDPKNQGGVKNESIIDEWQGSFVVSKDAGNFVPYMGARYGTLDFIRRTNEVDRKRITSDETFGVIVGSDYWLNERTKLNLEGTFLDGEELAIGISYDF